MADLIVMRPDFTPTVPDGPGRWEPGMVVDVFEDGQIGPGNEQHPRFIVIRIPGVSADKVRDFLDAHLGDSDPETGEPVVLKRRAMRLIAANLPAGVISQLQANREITVTETQVRNFIARVTS